MSPNTEKPAAEELPPDFQFSANDKFYFGPATCNLLHYKTAAVATTIIELAVMVTGVIAFYRLHSVSETLEKWVLLAFIVLFLASSLSSAFMCCGVFTENANLIKQKMAYIQIETAILMIFATMTICVMSYGLDLTNYVFEYFVRTKHLERDFGPIWPFNVSVVSYFAAAISVWKRVVVRGAYDFILDKEYFTDAPSIEMAKTLPKEE